MDSKNSGSSHACTVNESAKNPNGQRGTMSGAVVGAFNPPNAEMHVTKNITISPTSDLGHRRFDKD